MLSGLGQSEGLVERVLALAGGSDAAWLAGIAVVVGMMLWSAGARAVRDRKSTRLNSSHSQQSRMPSSA